MTVSREDMLKTSNQQCCILDCKLKKNPKHVVQIDRGQTFTSKFLLLLVSRFHTRK